MTGDVVRTVRWRPVAVPFRSLVANARETYRVRESLLFEVGTGAGVVGIGEVSLPMGPSLSRLGSDIDEFARQHADGLIGWHPSDAWTNCSFRVGSPGSWQTALICGLETAIADAASRLAGQPLSQWLSRPGSTSLNRSVRVNGLIDLTEPAGAAIRARTLVEEGYRTLKIKVGGDIARSIATVAAVREAVGHALELRCDANGAWQYGEARNFLLRCADYGVALCEEPLAEPGELYSSLTRLRHESPVPLAVDESTRTLAALTTVHATNAADAVVIKPMATGLRESMAMVEFTTRSGLATIVTTTFDLAAGTGMALHLAATLGSDAPACGLATLDLVVDPLGTGVPPIVGGRMEVPSAAGLGVELNHVSIDRYAVGPWREVCA